MSEQINKPKPSLVWPIVLIVIGVVFLLSNIGVVDWDVWPTMLRMWPLLLVAVGIDLMLGRRSGIWAGIAAVIILGIFAGGVWFFQTATGIWGGDLITQSISQDIDGAKQAEIFINMTVGVLEIDSMDTAGKLITGSIEILEDEDLHEDLNIIQDVASYELSIHGQRYFPSVVLDDRWEVNRDWQLNLSKDVLLDLNVDSGLGVADIDLSDLMLTNFSLDSGVGETTVFLPETGQYRVTIDAGVGQVTVHIPEGIEVRMHIDTGVGGTRIPSGFIKHGDLYYTEDYEGAENYVDLNINGGVGEIIVIQEN